VSTAIDEVRSFVEWLDDDAERAETAVAALVELADSERDPYLLAHPEARSLTVFEGLLRTARMERDREPAHALALTTFVLGHVDGLDVPPFGELALVALRARAKMEHGNVLAHLSRFHHAAIYFESAAADLVGDPAMEAEWVAAERGVALMRHELDENDGVLERLCAGREILRARHDEAGVMRSLLYESVVESDHGNYHAATARSREALARAEHLGDREMVARLCNNLGHFAQLMRDPSAARTYLTRALALFDELGMTVDRQRALWGLAQVRGDHDEIERAVDEMLGVIENLLAEGMDVEADIATLDLIEMLDLSDRGEGLEGVAAWLVRKFDRLGMRREARRALAYARGRRADASEPEAIDLWTILLRWRPKRDV
jgi:tetratricopeptide (TPR) repeat protein